MSVDADVSTSVDLLGKHVNDLQSDIVVGDTGISGELKAVTGYTGFSGDVSEQSGHYLVLHCDVPSFGGETITVELVGGVHGPVNLDADGIIIFRVTSNTQSVKITASKTGWDPVVKTYSLTDVTLAE